MPKQRKHSWAKSRVYALISLADLIEVERAAKLGGVSVAETVRRLVVEQLRRAQMEPTVH